MYSIPYIQYTQMTEIEKLKGKEVYQTYFITSEVQGVLQECKTKYRKVYANLVSHVTTMHKEDCIQKVKAFMGATVNGVMDLFVRRSKFNGPTREEFCENIS